MQKHSLEMHLFPGSQLCLTMASSGETHDDLAALSTKHQQGVILASVE